MSMHKFFKNRLAALLFIVLALITLGLGFSGYYTLYSSETTGYELWLNVLYSTIDLSTGGGSVSDPGLELAIGRFTAMVLSGSAIIMAVVFFFRTRIRQWWVLQSIRNHHVICGLGERGFALAKNLLENGDKVIVIEVVADNPYIERLRALKGVVIEGSATDEASLRRAALDRAAHLIALTESDATNLEVLDAVKDAYSQINRKCHIHIHIANRENRVLFDVKGRYFPPACGMKISLINVYESSAQSFFQDYLLGKGADTLTPGAEPIRLLLNGFGRMGEAILVEAMQMGHFCNHVPIEITVLDDDAEKNRKDFLRRYWEVEKHLGSKGLGLWELEFVSDLMESANPLNSYTDILACHDAEDEALRCIHYLWDRYHTQASVRDTRFFVHLPSGRQITNHEIHAFGRKNTICCKKFVVDEHLELAARRSHEMYARKELARIAADPGVQEKTRDAVASLLDKVNNNEISLNGALKRYDASQTDQARKLAWDNLSLFKRDSNKAEKRHMKIKLAALKLETPDLKNKDVSEQVRKYPWPKLDEFSEAELDRGPAFQMLTQAKLATGFAIEQIKLCIDDLAESEHARWNAFHVLNNYRHGDMKNESLRTHDCLLGWEQMGEKMPGKVKYDYQNVYQIYEVLNAVH